MKIEQINSVSPLQGSKHIAKGKAKSFHDTLKMALETANDQQLDYMAMVNDHLIGEEVELHQITIAAEKAKLTLDLTIQIRNKAMEAYQEIMRMQV